MVKTNNGQLTLPFFDEVEVKPQVNYELMEKELAEYIDKLKSEGKKVLTLQFAGRDILEDIINGSKKEETRMIYPHNRGKYIDAEYNPLPYDYLLLVNGRKANAPRVLVAVEGAHLFKDVDIDKDGNEVVVTYIQEGVTYYSIGIAYHLGEIVKKINI